MQEIWNIIILSSKDKDYETEYKHLIRDVTALKKHKNIRFIIYEFDHDIGPANTQIFEFAFTNERVEISAKDCPDLYKKEDLIHFFKTIVVKENSDTVLNRYIVITWGHGAGLGVFAMIEDLQVTKVVHDGSEFAIMDEVKFNHAKESAKKILYKQVYLNANNLIPEINLHAEISPIIKNFKISDDLEFKDENVVVFENFKSNLEAIIPPELKMLSGADLSDIFSTSFPEGTKIDALITVNCYTQCFEFGNRLREKVSLLVAPQTMIPFEGINYRQLFNFIKKHQYKRIEIEQIARNITSSFWPKYEFTSLNFTFAKKYPGFPLRDTSFSCNNLNLYDKIELIIGEVGNILNDFKIKSELLKFIIINARERCEDTTAGKDYGLIDFTVFFQNLMIELNIKKDGLTPQFEESLVKFFEDSLARLNTIYQDFIENIRKNCCLSLCLSQADSYIQYDGNTAEESQINISSRSPFFLSVFFPNNLNSKITSMLSPTVPGVTDRGDIKAFNYDNWITFFKNLFT